MTVTTGRSQLVLKGDLAATPLAQVLRPLADGAATGCLRLTDPAGQGAKVFLRSGRVYAVVAPGPARDIGERLVERGDLTPEALQAARDAQDDELQGWRLSELLVHLGHVEQDVVEAAVLEAVREALADLLPWGEGAWRFRVNERTRDDVVAPTAWDDLLAGVPSRTAWSTLVEVLHDADAVVSLSAAGTGSSHLSIGAAAWDLLCKVDGERTVTGLARECGLPLYEAGVLVRDLVLDGLLDVAAPEPPEQDQLVESFVPAAVASRLAQALSGRSFGYDMDDARADAPRSLGHAPDDALVSGSISRVSQSLSALLGAGTADDDAFSAPEQRSRPPKTVAADPAQVEQQQLDAARRERDAAELAAAQAELEAARQAARAWNEQQQQARDEEAAWDAERAAAEQAAVAQTEADLAEAERAEAEGIELQRIEAERAEVSAEAERVDAARAEVESAEVDSADSHSADAQHVEAELAEASSDELLLELSALSADPPADSSIATGAEHAEVMAELRASSAQHAPIEAPGDAAPAAAGPEPAPAPARMMANRDADTASLLRELSSLGLDDDLPPASPVRPARPPAWRQPAPAQRKRKGIFGR